MPNLLMSADVSCSKDTSESVNGGGGSLGGGGGGGSVGRGGGNSVGGGGGGGSLGRGGVFRDKEETFGGDGGGGVEVWVSSTQNPSALLKDRGGRGEEVGSEIGDLCCAGLGMGLGRSPMSGVGAELGMESGTESGDFVLSLDLSDPSGKINTEGSWGGGEESGKGGGAGDGGLM